MSARIVVVGYAPTVSALVLTGLLPVLVGNVLDRGVRAPTDGLQFEVKPAAVTVQVSSGDE